MIKRAVICLAIVAVTVFAGTAGQAQESTGSDSSSSSRDSSAPADKTFIQPGTMKVPEELPRANPNPPLRALVLNGGDLLQTFLFCIGIGGTLFGFGSLLRGKKKEAFLMILLCPLAGLLGLAWPQIRDMLLRSMGAE